jgi:hypothetical protein
MPPDAGTTSMSAEKASSQSAFKNYLSDLHFLLVAVLLFLCVALGALGFGLRPGTDEPPSVSNSRIQLYIFQQKSSTSSQIWPSGISIDETLIQKTPSVVQLQIDLFGSFANSGEVYWDLLTNIAHSQPYSCPDPYHYLGTASSNPLVIHGGGLTIMGQDVTQTVVADLVGRRVVKTATDILGLTGQSAREVSSDVLEPLGIIDLCWNRNSPLAFDGEYASAAIPTVTPYFDGGPRFPFHLTRSLYFDNPLENDRPLTAEYSLQAGSLPTSSDPFGWHWSSSPPGPVQLTALNIPQSQHETYLGFLSGVIFGVAGGAFVSLLQETLAPLRRRRAKLNESESPGG